MDYLVLEGAGSLLGDSNFSDSSSPGEIDLERIRRAPWRFGGVEEKDTTTKIYSYLSY